MGGEKTGLKAVDLACHLLSLGWRKLFIPISPGWYVGRSKFEGPGELASIPGLKIIASGNLVPGGPENIQRLERKGVSGVIIGKALYDGRFTLKKSLAIAAGKDKEGYDA